MDKNFNILPENWLNSPEFDEFMRLHPLQEAVSVKTRMKLAVAARRTSKRRAFLRKMRAKKRKNLTQLKSRARKVVRTQLRKRLFKGNWSSLSYSQRMRIDNTINKKKKFINRIVSQIMPKVVKGESERLRKLNLREEKTASETRIEARRRKQKQRAKEQEVRTLDPSRLAMVVRDQRGNLLIVDKNSFESDKHTVVIPASDMSYEVALRISKDEKFKNTLTSQRILGDKVSKNKEEKEEEKGGSASKEQQRSAGDIQQDVGMPSAPIQDTTQIDHKMAKWVPFLALKGVDAKEAVRQKMISPEQAREYAFSDNMQQFGNIVAANLADSFARITGRNLAEYNVMMLGETPYETSKLWKSMGLPMDMGKSDVIFVHNCVSESNKNIDCAKKNCECEPYGVTPEEQQIRLNIRYGSTSLVTGKATIDSKAMYYVVNQKVAQLISGSTRDVLGNDVYTNDSDKKSIQSIKDSLNKFTKFVQEKFKDYDNYSPSVFTYEKSGERVNKNIDTCLMKLKDLKNEINMTFKSIFAENKLSQKLYLNEILVGSNKFIAPEATATHMMTVDPENNTVKLNKLDETYINQIIDSPQFKFEMNFNVEHCGTELEETAYQETLQSYVANGKPLPIIANPSKFCGRISNKKLKENAFKFSNLKYLFEDMQKDEPPLEEDIFEAEYLKNYLKKVYQLSKDVEKPADQFNLLTTLMNVSPDLIDMKPIDLHNATEERSGKVVPIVINGVQRMIKMMNIPFFDSDDTKANENPMESVIFARKFITERKSKRKSKRKRKNKRNYRQEYDRYHARAEQKRNRARRNAARAKLRRMGRVKKGDGKDVDHKNGDPTDNSIKNLRVRSKSENRADNGN